MATQEELLRQQQALAAPKTAPRPVVARDPAAYAYDDPFMANAEEYVEMLNKNSQRYRVPEARRAEETGPATSSQDFKVMRNYLPDRPSEWERENQLRDARFDSWIVHDRGPQARMEMAKANLAIEREKMLREQWAREDANYYGGAQNTYQNVANALHGRNQVATGSELAAHRDMANLLGGGQTAAGYSRQADAAAAEAKKIATRNAYLAAGGAPGIAFDENANLPEEMAKDAVAESAPGRIEGPLAPMRESPRSPIPADVKPTWSGRLGSTLLDWTGPGTFDLRTLMNALGGGGAPITPGFGEDWYLDDQGNPYLGERSLEYMNARQLNKPAITPGQRAMQEKLRGVKSMSEARQRLLEQSGY